MFFRLLILLIVVPLLELYLLLKVGTIIGALNTIMLVILTAILGAYLTKIEGLKVLYQIRSNLENGIMPTEELIDGVLIFIAGAVLLTPGFITDIIGFLILIPTTRYYIKKWLKEIIRKRLSYPL